MASSAPRPSRLLARMTRLATANDPRWKDALVEYCATPKGLDHMRIVDAISQLPDSASQAQQAERAALIARGAALRATTLAARAINHRHTIHFTPTEDLTAYTSLTGVAPSRQPTPEQQAATEVLDAFHRANHADMHRTDLEEITEQARLQAITDSDTRLALAEDVETKANLLTQAEKALALLIKQQAPDTEIAAALTNVNLARASLDTALDTLNAAWAPDAPESRAAHDYRLRCTSLLQRKGR